MTSEELSLLKILSIKLFQTPGPMPEITSQIRELAKVHAVPAFISLEPAYIATNMRVKHAAQELHKILTEADIPYVILKGSASAYYYGKMEMYRSAGDVDFLVKDVDAASEALLSAGFIHPDIPDTAYHRAFEKDGIEYELHWSLNGLPENDKVIHHYLEDLLERAVLKSGMMMPDDFHHGIIILLHMAQHMANGIGLRHLCDWAVYVNQVDIGAWKDIYQECGLWQFARIATAASERYLGSKAYPWCADVDDGITEDIVEEILHTGNFGRRNRISSGGIFISDINTTGRAVGKTRIGTIIQNLNRISCNYFPVMKRWKILLPVGWVIIGIRYIYRVISGKRQLVTGKQMEEVRRKEKLFKELKLFEPDEY